MEDVGIGADKRQCAHQHWIWSPRMGRTVDRTNGRQVDWPDSWSELLLGMLNSVGNKRESSLIPDI